MPTTPEAAAGPARPAGRAGTVSVVFVREALAAAQRRHLGVEALCAAAGVDAQALGNDAYRVSAAAFGRLWRAIARGLDDEFFGLDARRMKVGSFALLARLTLTAPNLRSALRRMAEFFAVVLDDHGLELQVCGGEASLLLLPARGHDPHPDTVFAHETLLVLAHGLACWLIRRRIPVLRADFAYPRPPWHAEYRDVYAQTLGFEAPRTRLVFSALLLQAPVAQTERSLPDFLRAAPANFILKFKDENALSRRIRRQLRARAPAEWPGFDAIAAGLHLGATTLRRRLDREGSSFSAIRDELRRDLAIGYLTTTDWPLTQIAAELGFAEPSAFHRAFRQWTGLRPGDYRS